MKDAYVLIGNVPEGNWTPMKQQAPPRDVAVLVRLKNGTTIMGKRTGDVGRMAYEFRELVAGVDDYEPVTWRAIAHDDNHHKN